MGDWQISRFAEDRRIWDMDPRLTLEKRIEAELKSYDGMMCIYADDFHGNVIFHGRG